MFKTSAAYVSGAICGRTWMPDSMAGLPFQADVRQQINRFSNPVGCTFRDILLHLLMEKGGDFQNARFSEDTVIRIERRAIDGPGKYRIHVKELSIGSLPDCEDLIHADTFAGDFFGN